MGAGMRCHSRWVTSSGYRAGSSGCCQLTAASLASCPGETIKIVIEDYVQHLSGYFLSLKFDPELLFGTQFQYRNRIAVEFNQLYHWHGLMPDSFIIQGEEYNYEQFLYNTSMLLDYGVEALVESFSKQIAGRVRSCSPLPASAGAVGLREGCSRYREGSAVTAVTNSHFGQWVACHTCLTGMLQVLPTSIVARLALAAPFACSQTL